MSDNEMIPITDWAPNRRHEDICRTYGLDLVDEAEDFIKHGGKNRLKTELHWDRIFAAVLKDHGIARQPSPAWERHVTELENEDGHDAA
jgi:hypothetical protein